MASFRIATALSNSKLHLSIDDDSITASEVFSSTENWQTFETRSIEVILLDEGQHRLQLHFDGGAFNIARIKFTRTGPIDSPPFKV
ncbi:MAG: hypothetical protein ACJAZM_000113 [Cyclobacteriaceae bacterium]|jgi:hypothetical protein